MADIPEADRTRRVRAALWVIAVLLATFGVIIAIAMGSWWPVVLIAGLAVPLMPLGRQRA